MLAFNMPDCHPRSFSAIIGLGCSHVQAALKAGATRDHVLETAAVAVMRGGGPVYTYLPRVTEALDEIGTQSE